VLHQNIPKLFVQMSRNIVGQELRTRPMPGTKAYMASLSKIRQCLIIYKKRTMHFRYGTRSVNPNLPVS